MEIRHAFRVMTYDVDFAGVVSNIVYIRWLEDLRNLITDQTLPLGEALKRGIAPALTRTEIDYLAPARFADMIEGHMWGAEYGRAKFVLEAEFVNPASGQATARARQSGLFVSLATLRPVPLPAEYRR